MPEAEKAGERNYRAFISYRHKPLDMETAKKLHRRIEQYTVPADVRRNGEKKLGLVFRDQDELPISNNLSENIRTALDRSEFLIVVCTPDTPGSVWVQREIAYFKEHHDEDHVLAILAAGTPETSFPAQLTEKRDGSGKVTEIIEPLAANIAADSASKRNRLFRTESLRILASLIGCPYDALYRREQRRRTRKAATAAAAIGAALAVFIGVLLNRNAEILRQHRNTQINESRVLAALSENADREGDYRGSVSYALSALPEEDGRPYVAAAEYALSNALCLYQGGISMRYIQSFDQDTQIMKTALSEGSGYLATADLYEKLRIYDTATGKLLWEAQAPGQDVPELLFRGNDRIIAINGNGSGSRAPNTVCYAAKDGKVIWQLEPAIHAYTEGKKYGLAVDSAGNDRKARIRKVDLENGTVLAEIQDPERKYPDSEAYAVSPDGRYAALIFKGNDDRGEAVVYDLEERSIRHVSSVYFKWLYMAYRIRFTERNELVIACSGDNSLLRGKEGWEGAYIALLDPEREWQERFHTVLDFGEGMETKFGVRDDSGYPKYLGYCPDAIAVSSKTRLIMVERETGEVRWVKDLPGYIKAAKMYESGALGLALSNGLITLCEESTGTLSKELNMGFFECDYNIHVAAAEGGRFITTCYAAVPEKNPTRAAMVAFAEGEDLEAFPYAENIPRGAKVYTSPSGKTGAVLAENGDRSGYRILMLDFTGKEAPAEYEIGNMRAGVPENQIFVTDGGKVIIGDHAADPREGKDAWMTGREDERISQTPQIQSCREPGTGSVLSARVQETGDGGCMLHVWKDGEAAGSWNVPVKDNGEKINYLSKCICLAVGGGGYAVAAVQPYNQPWQYTAVSTRDGSAQEIGCLNPEAENCLAVADEHPWMAVQDPEGEMRLTDLPSGETRLVFDSPLPGRGIRKLLFANGDKWLLAFTYGGELGIFSTEDGKLIHRSSYKVNLIWFRSDARYETFLVPEQNRLLIIDSDSTYREALCISIDTETSEKNGLYAGFSNWLPETGKAVIVHASDGVYLARLLSMEEIRKKGEKFLEEGIRR